MKKLFRFLFFFAVFFSFSYCLTKFESKKYLSEPSLTQIDIQVVNQGVQNLVNKEDKTNLSFITNYNDHDLNIFDSSDIEVKTSFTINIQEENDIIHKASCNLCKLPNDLIAIECNLNQDDFKEGEHDTKINDISFKYKEYQINIFFNENKFIIEIPKNNFNELIITIPEKGNDQEKIIGEDGIISFVTDYNDKELNIFDTSDIEEKTLFDMKITDEFNKEYNTNCRLWKPKNDKLRLLCHLNEKLNSKAKYIKLNTIYFTYFNDNNEYNIKINPEIEKISIIQIESQTHFIYSAPQEMLVKNDIDTNTEEKKIDLRIKEEDNNWGNIGGFNLGLNGTLYFKTDYNDNETNVFNSSDIEEKTKFTTTIYDEEKNSYNINCRLFKPTNEKLVIICNIDNDLKLGQREISLQVVNFTYEEYFIPIIPEISIKVNQLNYSIPFLYSDKQYINLNDDIGIYELKFKSISYNNDLLILGIYLSVALENCEAKQNEIICKITKEKILSIISTNIKFKFEVVATISFVNENNNDNIGTGRLDLVYPIYINYEIGEKQDIFITITKLLVNITERMTPIAYETNETDIPEIVTLQFILKFTEEDASCYFQKYKSNNLLLLCQFYNGGEMHLKKIEEEIILDNIHYKYNFRIQPVENNEIILTNSNYGFYVNFLYPTILDFTSQESIIIRYMGLFEYAPQKFGFRLNPDSEFDLECRYLNSLTTCIVPLSHFKNKESGYYYTYHLNHLNEYSRYYSIDQVKVILPRLDNTIEIKIEEELNPWGIFVGKKGTIDFVTSFTDTENIFDINDIEETTKFETYITDEEQNSYKIFCRLWKPLDDNLRLFCYLNETLINNETSIILNNASFIYKDYNITINSYIPWTYFVQIEQDSPFLYSDKQIINLDEEKDKDVFEIKFKIGNYNNELLYIGYKNDIFVNLILENLKIKGNELIFQITKEEIEELIILNESKFNLMAHNDLFGIWTFSSVLDIVFIKNYDKQENIYLNINKLLDKNIGFYDFVAYDTNITESSISNLHTKGFDFSFGKNMEMNSTCYFKKAKEKPLILICYATEKGYYSLGEIKEEIILDNIHSKYNFIITPVNNDEEFFVGEISPVIFLNYPKILDFNYDDEINIKFLLADSSEIKGIKLNPDVKDLECVYNDIDAMNCVVPKNHFERKSSGNYYTYHLNQANTSSIFYSISPIKVLLPIENEFFIKIKQEDNDYGQILGENGVISFVTDYNDNELNIFNISDIEEKTLFDTKIMDEFNNEYNTNCRLWKPKNDKLRLLCHLNEKLKNEENNIINITTATFEYNNEYNITIISEVKIIKIYQKNVSIPFIYADTQEILVKNDIDTYKLKFKADFYNNELFELFDKNFNRMILDKCHFIDKEIICTIEKKNIEEILAYNEEIFYLRILINNYGSYYVNNIYGIKFNYYNITKEDIYINIIKLKEKIAEKNHLIAYETNITDNYINNVITEAFTLMFNDNEKAAYCFFKKSENTNLLILCKFDSAGTYYLENIENPIELNNISILYNFIIQPVHYNEAFTITDDNNIYIFNNYPKILNFTNQNMINISFTLPENDLDLKIKLNPESDILECEKLLGLLNCKIPLSHFDWEENGFYYIYYVNSEGDLTIYYEVSPFNVILPERHMLKLKIKEEDNKEDIILGEKGTLYFITNYNDNETNIFDSFDIEEKTNFTTTIYDEEKNSYNVNCILFKPTNEKLVIICNLDDNLIQENNNITLNETRLTYNEYNITIISETFIKVNQLNYSIPFLYSDKQYINFKDDDDDGEVYELEFKKISYNNDLLYIYGSLFDHFVLDNCAITTKELFCKISKEKLGHILSKNNEVFKLGNMNDNFGLIKYNLVYDININYEITEKKNISVRITKLLENTTELLSFIAYETNIDSISELNTQAFKLEFVDSNRVINSNCFFKKSKINNLLIICMMEIKGDFHLKKIEQEIILDNIHYKYNFRIQPTENNETVNISQIGNWIQYVYPQKLDFTSQGLLTIRYIISYPSYVDKLKLNPDSESYLECDDLIKMKKCTIPLNLFQDKENGYYYTHHLNHLNRYSVNYEANPINVILPDMNITIKIGVEDKDNINLIKLGQKGLIYLVTNYNDTENIFAQKDLDKINFEVNFTSSMNDVEYKSLCKLWKPENENIRIICHLNENMELGEQNIYMEKINFIYKDKYNIAINYKGENIKVKQLNYDISFLYTEKQKIDIRDNVDNYELKFKIYKYDNQPLYLYKNNMKVIPFDYCQSENNDILTCKISKDKILDILSYKNEKYSLAQNLENEGFYLFTSVLDISINYHISKITHNIQIGKLLTPFVLKNEFIAYETNMSAILPFITDYFEIGTESMKCLLKKNDDKKNIFLLCDAKNAGKNSLGKINEMTLDNINIYYNIIIKESENSEQFEVPQKEGTKIFSLSPLELNFTKEENYTIQINCEFPEKLEEIKLNNESLLDLDCENKIGYKECSINKTHFTKSGYYYLQHSNYNGSKLISYETPMIKVIIEEEKPNPTSEPSDPGNDGDGDDDNNLGLIIGLSIWIGVIALLIIIFFVWHYVKRRNISGKDGDDENKELVVPISFQLKEAIKDSEFNEDRNDA